MKVLLYKLLTFSALILAAGLGTNAEVTSSLSNNNTITPQVDQVEVATKKVLNDAGIRFRQGLVAYRDRDMKGAGINFNGAVEVFLMSTQDVRKNPSLVNCYDQLIESVYRIEFPGTQPAGLSALRDTCGWKAIDNELISKVIDLSRGAGTKPVETAGLAGGASPQNNQSKGPVDTGFLSQNFEPSPLDELSKVQLTSEEEDVTTPEAQAQYQYIQYAVANKSLGFSFQVHPMIQQFINYYRGRGHSTMEIGLYRSGMFMRMARRIFKEEGVPENVAWLGQVESTWKPTALSTAAASGLWQFIPGTGSRFGLNRNAYVDERNSFDEATRASARYLKFLANRYHGNWELAMAAYNSGEGNVDRAIRLAGAENFWLAFRYLPTETRNYVPNILATILIANAPNQYGFGHIRPAAPLVYDRVRVPGSTNLSILAQASDTSVQYLRYLNPHLRSNTTPPEPYIVNVPKDKGDDVVAVFRRIPASKLNNTNLANSSNGETWQTISNRTGISVSDLMAANPGMANPTGKVFVPTVGNNVMNTSYVRPTSTGSSSLAPGVRVVKARAGDTVQKIAERERVDATELAKYNGLLTNSVLGAGREIKIPSK